MNFDKQKVINLIQGTKANDITLHQINRINPKAENEAIAAIKEEHQYKVPATDVPRYP